MGEPQLMDALQDMPFRVSFPERLFVGKRSFSTGVRLSISMVSQRRPKVPDEPFS